MKALRKLFNDHPHAGSGVIAHFPKVKMWVCPQCPKTYPQVEWKTVSCQKCEQENLIRPEDTMWTCQRCGLRWPASEDDHDKEV